MQLSVEGYSTLFWVLLWNTQKQPLLHVEWNTMCFLYRFFYLRLIQNSSCWDYYTWIWFILFFHCSLHQFLHVVSVSTTLRKLCPSVGENNVSTYGSMRSLPIKWALSGSGMKIKGMRLGIYLLVQIYQALKKSKNIIFSWEIIWTDSWW